MQIPVNKLHTNFLAAFADVFCFFCENFGGFDQITIELLSVQFFGAGIKANENNIRKRLFKLIKKYTVKNPYAVFLTVEIITLFPNEKVFKSPRHKLLKKRIINNLNSARNNRLQLRYNFSATHFITLFKSAYAQFAGNLDGSFNFVKIARNSNPITQSLYVYLSNFFNFVKPPNHIIIFIAPIIALNFLLNSIVTWAFKKSVSSLKGRKTISVNTFVNFIKTHLKKYVESLIAGAIPTADIHSENFIRFANKWAVIKSSDTYLICLRRRPLYDLYPGYTICNNYVRIFGLCADDNPSVWTFEKYVFYQNRLSEKTRIRIHPPTAGVKVFYFDGGGVRGTLLTTAWSPVSLLGQFIVFLVFYFNNGLYFSQQIKSVLKHIFGADKKVLNISNATANGNFIGFPVATVNEEPIYRIFISRNGVY
ncbi:hypothetical protein PpBr36_02294 [Pyricularia pennisetigena]|uniref:hypothetical protein n=1 Tax=Pyricularia pennisetigena TaxID=1578925 RepID=UPI001150E486|nr:hypothetical protein PpBr36_02294 [Pyricularia pennisetigena]TLS31088.1 hypothetical protein PpBr36_02294 [Pyricularia pennisetigena]